MFANTADRCSTSLPVTERTERTERSERPSARVVLIDEHGSVLLFRVEDAHQAGPPVWTTPGGGIESGESVTQAALRELTEETGLSVPPQQLGEPVGACRGGWEFRGRPLYSVDWFFFLRTQQFEPSRHGWSDLEHELHTAWRWWTPDELDATDEAVLPASLGTLVRTIAGGEIPSEPIELPWIAF